LIEYFNIIELGARESTQALRNSEDNGGTVHSLV